jgi:hypothetical protein
MGAGRGRKSRRRRHFRRTSCADTWKRTPPLSAPRVSPGALLSTAEWRILLEALEQHLTVLEQKLIAIARSRQTEAQALAARHDLESHLRAWRSKMTAPQIAMLEAQYLDRSTLESAGLPRLSLFYLR